MDVLSDVLDTVRLTSTVFVRTELTPPWGIRAKPGPYFAFHVLSRGRAWLEVDGLPPTELAAGDVVVLAPGRGHSLRDSLDSPLCDIEDLLATGGLDCAAGGGTQLVCGSFEFAQQHGNALLPVLPVVLHARELANEVGPWLAQTIKLLTYESFTTRPGTATVLNRLCDALFVYLLRSYLAGHPDANWLRALEDPQIGAALQLMHAEPGRPWRVPTLATHVGMSRSAFAARFSDLVGDTPMNYLTRWRLQKAAALLRESTISIDDIATQIGYDSPAAFGKAFRRTIGTPPATYRRTAKH